eukprot:UN16546
MAISLSTFVFDIHPTSDLLSYFYLFLSFFVTFMIIHQISPTMRSYVTHCIILTYATLPRVPHFSAPMRVTP